MKWSTHMLAALLLTTFIACRDQKQGFDENGWHFIKLILLGLVSIWPVILLITLGWIGWQRRRLSKTR